MRIPGWFFWLLCFVAATFGWFVFFEHGPGLDSFRDGARVEFDRLWNSSARWIENHR